ncbi:MAG: hypothetical protein WC205_05280 [Opitutaceae bacterium]|jgi:hypothetical protein
MPTFTEKVLHFCLAILLPLTLAAADTSLPPGADVAEIVFDETPVERGLTFERGGWRFSPVALKGKTESAWVLENGTDPAMRWLRPIFLKVTDPRFQKGGRPAVDIEITFHNPGFGSVRVKGDTTEGAQTIGSLWGNSKEWKTLRFPIDNAFFGARVDDKDTKPLLNGFDLRIDGINGPFYLKRVRLIGYNPTEDVLWSRMLKVSAMGAPTPGKVLAFTQGADRRLDVQLKNVARVDRPLHYRLQITGQDDQVRHRVEAKAVVSASGMTDLPFAFDTSNWPLGPYEGRLELFLGQSRARPVYTRSFRLGVISQGELAKARPGEFLYGLDAANNTIFPILTPTAFAYYRLMGVDLLRSPYNTDMRENVADLGRALSMLAAEQVQSAVMIDPPKDQDAGKRAAQLNTKVAFIEEASRLYSGAGVGKLHYYEMGNEPDLVHFYPAEIPTYIESYQAMYDAVKRGARAAGLTDADTVVMNGGLSFAGTNGARRAAEFVEKVDASKLDAIGYHGHGAGIEAERSAYERLQRVAEKCGKARIPFIETESGFSGVDRIGLAEQARTVVEKMTYAQSKGAPIFIFFRLFMEGTGIESGYTMAENFIEPRPSVLSYRNLVERLRHHRFERELNFAGEAGADGITSYLFAEIDAAGAPTGRKTVVAFCEKPIRYELRLGLDEPDVKTGAASAFDLYGNALPVETMRDVATFSAGMDPVFVTWTSPGAAVATHVMPPLLTVDATQPLLPGTANPLSVTVRNARADQPLDIELGFTAGTRLATKVEPANRKLTIPAGGSVQVPFTVTLGGADQPLGLPAWWTVFTDIDAAALKPAQLVSVPARLPAKDGGAAVAGRQAATEAGRLNFARLAGGFGENRTAVAYAFIDSPRAVEMECGASGDWYMAWYLNGEKVQDTLEQGNGQHGPISLHPFKLKLKAGRNVVAVIVTSGRGGWDVQLGGPKELRIARTAGDDPDNVTVVMKAADGRTLSQQKEPLVLASVVPALGTTTAPWPESWLQLEPLAVLGSDAVDNFWVKEPDQSRWYRGEKDLSAVAWLRRDGDLLRLFVAVKDDALVQAVSSGVLSQNDSLRALITDEEGKPLLDMTGGLVANRAVTAAEDAGVEFKVVRREGGDATTYYQVSFPKARVGGGAFRVNLHVTDNDAGYLKQALRLGDVESPAKGKRGIAE